MTTKSESHPKPVDRRNFFSLPGKGLGLAALSSATVGGLLVFASLLLPLNISQAQDPQPSPAPLPTQLVKFTMIAADKKHHSVDDLRQEEIQLEEDKQPLGIVSFSKDLRPVDYALVVDASGSFRKVFSAVVEMATTLVNGNQADDKTFVERFVDSATIEKVQEFTADKTKLTAALDSLRIEGGQSAVVDAVYEAIRHTAEYKHSPAERRRAVVLFTDGEDRASYYSSDKLVKLIRENDVQVFIIGIVKLLDLEGSALRVSPREKAELLLKRIAQESGGRVFFPEDLKETQDAIAEIQHDLHSQYLVEFETPTKPGEKGFRKLEVKVANSPGREKLKAITRPVYSVNVQPAAPNAPEKKHQ